MPEKRSYVINVPGEKIGEEKIGGNVNNGYDGNSVPMDEAGVGGDKASPSNNVNIEADNKLFHYDVYENPPILLTIVFAMQQVLMSLSRSLSTSLLVADVVCARNDENYKARLLSTTLFVSGLTTFLQNTIGIRLPLYQGPSATYVIPLLAMSELPEWMCTYASSDGLLDANVTMNVTDTPSSSLYSDIILDKTHMLQGSLMIAGAFHLLVGMTGLVGFLLRFIGPVTVIPALTILALYVYRATTKFAKTQWGVSMLTVSMAVILSFYLRNVNTPVPAWSRDRGFHIKWYPLQKMFSVLTACLVGWAVSGILTASGVFSEDPDSVDYFARTDSRVKVIEETDWFIFPYPGQFGFPSFNTGAFITFMMGTISSIIDSIGDYYACTKVIAAPPPPKHAVNRGIVVEGFMSFIGGWSGAGHATSTFGGNIGAIGITRVASLRVFQFVGLIFILFGVVGKVGAVFVTVPYSVIGGIAPSQHVTMMINFGVLVGVMLSNLQFIDLDSTRNLAIIGISMLTSLMFPYWIQTTPDGIDTGYETADKVIKMFLANPAFMAGFIACFMDNTIPGTPEERGMIAWKAELGVDKDEVQTEKEPAESPLSAQEHERNRKLLKTIYTVPLAERLARKCPCLRRIPFYPH